MDVKIIAIIAVAAVAVAGGAAAAVMMGSGGGNGGDSPKDASQIASSFSKNYTGFFGTDFYLEEGATASSAKAYYPNEASGGYGSTNNYITFKAFDKTSEAKEEFDTNKADYQAQIGKTVMGSTVKGTTEKAGLDDAIGYYNNFNMGTKSVYIYYTGYKANLFFEGYIYLKNTSIDDDTEIAKLANAINDAIANPVTTEQAKMPISSEFPALSSDMGAAFGSNDFAANAVIKALTA